VNIDIIKKFNQLNIWKSGGKRAPHKPLLLLLALEKIQSGYKNQFLSYTEIEEKLSSLIYEFAPYSKAIRPQYPFWRLKNDSIWNLINAEEIQEISKSGDVNKNTLIKYNVMGGFTDEIYLKLKEDDLLLNQIANHLINAHFPDSLHEDVKKAVGLNCEYSYSKKKKRDPNFRPRILKAYEYKCAICEFDIRYDNKPIGIEAAHIKWHQAGGTDLEENGIALCIMHHKLFDRGAFTINPKMKISLSEFLHGGKGFEEWLLKFHNQKIHLPQRPAYYPNPEFVNWHVREVFKGPARYST